LKFKLRIKNIDLHIYFFSWFVGYPELATGPGPYKVETQWGVMKPTMDPTKETTYLFLDDFFKEMTELFPDPYFHIGGDEVEGSQWAQSPVIQAFIQKLQLENKNGLQAYFNKRIQKMLKKYHKIMVGWEEILDEIHDKVAVSKSAVIQAWKSRKALVNAINKGYRGLLSNGYYLDHLVTSATYYKVDPILDDELWLFNETQLSHILGGEACMWSEYVSENTVDSRIWPRTLAIAERFWSPSSINDPNFLYKRLFRMNHLLDKMQIGLTHLSLYKLRLKNLINKPDNKATLLHPFVILADACEPYGFEQRAQTGRYSANVSLTTFTDALQSESEMIWKLENVPIDYKKFREIFHKWSINHVRLRQLFDENELSPNKQLWGQDIKQLSKNLAETGHIGLKILDYATQKILHYDKNNSMNSWPLVYWISHHSQLLFQLENQVNEVRLAAIRPVRRLLNTLEATAI
jgi:hexosaminidase